MSPQKDGCLQEKTEEEKGRGETKPLSKHKFVILIFSPPSCHERWGSPQEPSIRTPTPPLTSCPRKPPRSSSQKGGKTDAGQHNVVRLDRCKKWFLNVQFHPFPISNLKSLMYSYYLGVLTFHRIEPSPLGLLGCIAPI